VSVGKVVEDDVVPTGGAVGRRWTGAVAAARVARQAAAVVGRVVGRRTFADALAVFDVVHTVAVALVRTVLATGATFRVARRARLYRTRQIHT